MTPEERAAAVVKAVRDDEMFNVPSDDRWRREIANAIRAEIGEVVPIEDFLELYDAAHAVIDHIRVHADHAEYEGSMNAVEDFREIALQLRWKHADKVRDPLTGLTVDEEGGDL